MLREPVCSKLMRSARELREAEKTENGPLRFDEIPSVRAIPQPRLRRLVLVQRLRSATSRLNLLA